MDLKICTRCGIEKSVALFSKQTAAKTGFRSHCKECVKYASEKYRASHKQESSAYKKEWRIKNAEKNKADKEAWRKANMWKWAARSAAERLNNPEVVKSRNSHQVVNLNDGYVASALGLRVDDCTGDLIQSKREQLQMHRLLKDLNAVVKQAKGETDECVDSDLPKMLSDL